MKLYPIPGGGWAGTEADWKAAMKAKGLNPKDFEATKTREVPTGKKELMEFLTFFAVDVYRTGSAPITTGPAPVDVDALRDQHNPAPDAPRTPVETTTEATLSRIDNPGIDVDGIVEIIGAAKGWALKRYSGAVAVAFQMLTND